MRWRESVTQLRTQWCETFHQDSLTTIIEDSNLLIIIIVRNSSSVYHSEAQILCPNETILIIKRAKITIHACSTCKGMLRISMDI